MQFIVLRYRRVLKLIITGVLILLGFFLLSGVCSRVVGVYQDNIREVPVYSVDTKEKKLAISFDAAWGPIIHPLCSKYWRKTTLKQLFSHRNLGKGIPGNGQENSCRWS